MSKTVTVEVTQEDIDRGKPEDPHCCPVARATRRVIGKPCRVECDDFQVLINGQMVEVPCPEQVNCFVREFDEAFQDMRLDEDETLASGYWRDQFSPFSFTLELPDEA